MVTVEWTQASGNPPTVAEEMTVLITPSWVILVDWYGTRLLWINATAVKSIEATVGSELVYMDTVNVEGVYKLRKGARPA